MAKMMGGRATVEGTRRYTERFTGRLAAGHFRELEGGTWLSTLGLGTYLGPEDGVTDVLYQDAVLRLLELGVNVIDTAVNYRHQRSERAIRTALATAIARGVVGRDEVVVATKGGFISFDGAVPRDPRAYFAATYVDTGIIKPGEVVRGHCMSPRYLRDQIDRSRANLGLETLDVYYLHNPETQLAEVARPEFLRRIRAAFEALEEAVAAGCIARYGTATWTGFCVDPGAPDYLSLAELVSAARDVGGNDHHFKVIQLPYNLGMTEAFTRANQRVNDRMVPVLEAARQLGVYVMASASVHQGQLTRNLPPLITEYIPGLTSDAQRALQFVRSTPGVGTALVGMKSPEHVEENTKVGAIPPMGWEHFQRLFSAAGG